MEKIHNLMLAATVVLSVAACSGDTITATADDSFSARLARASGNTMRPWKGRCDAVAAFTGENTLLITGTCQLAHLGRTTVIADETIRPRADGFDVTRVSTYTAANGDQLRTVSAGVALYKPDFSGLLLSYGETAVGGTGRFANASGTAILTGETVFATGKGFWTLDGSLTY